MDGDMIGLIIAIVISICMGASAKIGKAVKKAAEGTTRHDAPQSQTPHPAASSEKDESQQGQGAFKTLKDLLEDEDADDTQTGQPYWEETAEDGVEVNDKAEQNRHNPVAAAPSADYVDGLGNRIFDYESNAATAASDGVASQHKVADKESAEDENAPAFDLRQAVICQTILQNKYVSDWK